MALFITSCSDNQSNDDNHKVNPSVLLFSKTKSFRHESIETGRVALQSYFDHHGMSSTISEDSSVFTDEGLQHFDAIVFFQTSGNVLDSLQQIAFVKYIQSGKGFVGIHAASDTEYDWPWYGKLVGAYFANHPNIQEHFIQKVDTAHVSCKHLPDRWKRTDEVYNFVQLPDSVNVLLTADESTFDGGTHGDYHPMAWYHLYDGGRAFYTALGHTVESYQDTMLLEHIYQAIVWASGK